MTAAFGASQIIGPALTGHLRDVTGSFLWPALLAALALLLAAALAELGVRVRSAGDRPRA